MYKNRILPKYANQMKNNIESSSIVSKIQVMTNLIFKNSNSSAEVLQEFQKELNKLDKKILVIYEDIDRINNADVIREVFSISEKISSENIKVIYQYDESIMEKLGLTPDYLEKYIPYKVNLTELHFREILQFELRNIDESILSIKDFDFLNYQATRFTVLQDFFEFESDYVMEIKYIPIRKVKQLIGELMIILHTKKELYIDYKEVVISFYLLKHLHWEAYKKLDMQEGLLDAIKFTVEGKGDYSILQLIRLFREGEITQENLREMFSDPKNKENYSILKLFQYKVLNPEKYTNKERLSILEEEAKHWNEKTDRIIWNLLYEGKSIFTDFENAAHKLSSEVLAKPKEEQRLAYQDFWSYFFYTDDIITDNTTIFKIGSPVFLELFKSFKVADISNDNQIKLVDFYFEYNNLKTINLESIKCLNYCPLRTTDEYLSVLGHVNRLEVIGNLRKEKEFSKFLNKYIHVLTSLGYFHSYHYFDDIKELIENQAFLLGVFTEMMEDLNEMKLRHQEVQLQSTTDDLKVIILFLQKIIDVLKCEEELVSNRRPSVSTEYTSRKINQEEFDRLQELMESEEDTVIGEIEVSYVNNKITLYEANELLKQFPDC